MSEVNHSEPMDAMENPGMTEEELAALEAERQAAFDAKVALYRALKEQIDTLTEIQETILAP
jgi:tRNA splicing endonuclease